LRLAHGDKLTAPAVHAAEIARNSSGQSRTRPALVAEASKVQFMKNHRVSRDQLFAFQPVDQKARGARVIEPGELSGDRVEAVDRAGVIVLVMADEDFLRKALSGFRLRIAISVPRPPIHPSVEMLVLTIWAAPRPVRLVGQIPGFSRQTGNFVDFPQRPPFGYKDGEVNQALASEFP
jgi:hypothetical protein